MITYYNVTILIVAVLLVWIPWLWRYRIRPRAAKAQLKKLLKNHPEAQSLIDKENFLVELYQTVNARRISQQERKRLGITEDAFVYGEIEFLPFFTILDRVKPQSHEIFYDLGSGSGKAVMTATCYFDLSKACGIELLPGLFAAANAQIQKAYQLKKIDSRKIASIKFINDNFIEYDFSDGDIIFINATCLDYFIWEKLLTKLTCLKSGSRVIVTTKKIAHEQFEVIYSGMDLMSWGMNTVNIYRKT